MKLGDKVPRFEDLWVKSTDNKMASSSQLDDTIYVGGISQLRAVVAANMTMNEGETLHYRYLQSILLSYGE